MSKRVTRLGNFRHQIDSVLESYTSAPKGLPVQIPSNHVKPSFFVLLHVFSCFSSQVGRAGLGSFIKISFDTLWLQIVIYFLMTCLCFHSLSSVNLSCKHPQEATHSAPFSSSRGVNEQGSEKSFSLLIARKMCLPASVFIKSNFASP